MDIENFKNFTREQQIELIKKLAKSVGHDNFVLLVMAAVMYKETK